jgi:hypothetical protein
LLACSANGSAATGDPPASDTAPTTPPPPVVDAGPAMVDASPAADASSPPSKPKNDCKLPDLPAIADVTPAFVTIAPPSVSVPAMSGGTLSGQYLVDAATVYLPSGTAGLADPQRSTGTVNAWAIFDGTNYRIHLKASFVIASVAGPQAQGADSASQGGFTVSGAALTLDHACDTVIPDEADYSFTDTGNGRATILIKTPSPYGDTYLELDATKM